MTGNANHPTYLWWGLGDGLWENMISYWNEKKMRSTQYYTRIFEGYYPCLMISGLYHPRLVMSQDLRNPSRTPDSCDGNSRWFWHPKLFSWFTDQRSFIKMIYHYHIMFIYIYYHCYVKYNRMTYWHIIQLCTVYHSIYHDQTKFTGNIYFWSTTTTHGVSTFSPGRNAETSPGAMPLVDWKPTP